MLITEDREFVSADSLEGRAYLATRWALALGPKTPQHEDRVELEISDILTVRVRVSGPDYEECMWASTAACFEDWEFVGV